MATVTETLLNAIEKRLQTKTQREIAGEMGVDPSALCRWRQRRTCNNDTIDRAARYLKLKLKP